MAMSTVTPMALSIRTAMTVIIITMITITPHRP